MMIVRKLIIMIPSLWPIMNELHYLKEYVTDSWNIMERIVFRLPIVPETNLFQDWTCIIIREK